jgi:hypothetical protein
MTNLERTLQSKQQEQHRHAAQEISNMRKEVQAETKEISAKMDKITAQMQRQETIIQNLMDKITQVEKAQSKTGSTANDLEIYGEMLGAEEERQGREEDETREPRPRKQRNGNPDSNKTNRNNRNDE